LNVQLFYHSRRVDAVYIHVVAFVVDEEERFTDGLNVLHFVAFDAMNIRWCLMLLVKIFKAPNLAQILLPHELVGILCRLLNTIEDFNIF